MTTDADIRRYDLTDFQRDQVPLLDRFLGLTANTIADLGAGLGIHARLMIDRSRIVHAVDQSPTNELRQLAAANPDHCRIVIADVAAPPFDDASLDGIWASHCLEHLTDPLAALERWRRMLKPNARLAVIVPPFKTEVVGRHVFTGWTIGQLALTLLRTGYCIRDGAFRKNGYNICAIVRPDPDPPTLKPNDEILCEHADRFPPLMRHEILRNKRTNTFGETISCFDGAFESVGW
ncbi:MAG: class I SAM-dependent methyltransferase [Phycisphaerales bacterium]|nr:class I SAM-dependent methyltransferase [Phycisphaerales bacterium]MCB9864114.1 class I SAM-dependent methyltransferase [Phycisphaerales bacterium]